MSRNIMSIGRIMYSKMPTKRKLSHFFGFGLPSNIKRGSVKPKEIQRQWTIHNCLDLIANDSLELRVALSAINIIINK